MLPPWLRSHLSAGPPSRYTFESFVDEVSRLLDLSPVVCMGELRRGAETDHVWLLWQRTEGGAVLVLDRPHGELRESVSITVQWHQSPNPADIAAMVRAYERQGRWRVLRSLLARALCRR